MCDLWHGGPGSGTDYTYAGKSQSNDTWPQYTVKLSGILQPHHFCLPRNEHPDNINDGYFDDGTQRHSRKPHLLDRLRYAGLLP